MEQLKTIGRELAMGSQGGFDQSKEFLDLIKSIGEARSKAEENRIVLRYSQEEDERMWPSLIAKAKSGGIDLIDTYMFGNIHESAVRLSSGQIMSHSRRSAMGYVQAR